LIVVHPVLIYPQFTNKVFSKEIV